MAITGGCLCRAVHYSADEDPIPGRTLVCHCTTCQRHIGSAFATFVCFPRGAVAVAGTLKTYTEPGGMTGEPIHRRFCPNCGTPILLEKEGSPRTLVAAEPLTTSLSSSRPSASFATRRSHGCRRPKALRKLPALSCLNLRRLRGPERIPIRKNWASGEMRLFLHQ
jgi:hypothetical protein